MTMLCNMSVILVQCQCYVICQWS